MISRNSYTSLLESIVDATNEAQVTATLSKKRGKVAPTRIVSAGSIGSKFKQTVSASNPDRNARSPSAPAAQNAPSKSVAVGTSRKVGVSASPSKIGTIRTSAPSTASISSIGGSKKPSGASSVGKPISNTSTGSIYDIPTSASQTTPPPFTPPAVKKNTKINSLTTSYEWDGIDDLLVEGIELFGEEDFVMMLEHYENTGEFYEELEEFLSDYLVD